MTQSESVPLVLAECEVFLPLAGLVDLGAEKAKLEKELAQEEAEIQRLLAKLSNESFVGKAPAAVVDKERERLAEFSASLERLQSQAARLAPSARN